MRGLLPLLFILICPVMTLFMMRGHGHGAHADGQHRESVQVGIGDGHQDAEVAAILEQRAQLAARVEDLEAQMGRLQRSQEADLSVPTPV